MPHQTVPQPGVPRQKGAEERLSPGDGHDELLFLRVDVSGDVGVWCRPRLPECSEVRGALPVTLVVLLSHWVVMGSPVLVEPRCWPRSLGEWLWLRLMDSWCAPCTWCEPDDAETGWVVLGGVCAGRLVRYKLVLRGCVRVELAGWKN